MKKPHIFFLFMLLFACNQAADKQTKNEAGIISGIKTKLSEINEKIPSLKKVEMELAGSSAEGGELESYYQHEELKKIVASYHGERGKLVEEYYFEEDTLFFALTQSYSYDRPMHVGGAKVTKMDENQYYLHNNELVSWVGPGEEELAPSKFKQKESALLQKAMALVERSEGEKTVYAWVDRLNIRDQPNTKGKVITSVDSNDALALTETKSEGWETLVLRGAAYQDYWYKVRTADGKEGWVFGGAVKRKNERKGNDILTKEKFDFPYFGDVDLSEWEKMKSEDFEGGDVEGTISLYKKANRILELSDADMGDYGFRSSQKLMDPDKKTLKERDFSFNPPEKVNGKNRLVEEVKDYTQNPPKIYSRIQEIDASRYDLNSLPLMAVGTWKTEIISSTEPNGEAINMKSFFSLSPVAIFDDTTEGLSLSEKEDLLNKEESALWKITDESKTKLTIRSKHSASEVTLRFLKNNDNLDGLLFATVVNERNTNLHSWKYSVEDQALQKTDILKKYAADDFVSKEDQLPDSYKPILHYQFIDDETIEVSLNTWMEKEFENREIINRIFLKWNGESFEEEIVRKGK